MILVHEIVTGAGKERAKASASKVNIKNPEVRRNLNPYHAM